MCCAGGGPFRVNSNQSKPISTAEVIGNLRDLTVHLHRGNGAKAESIIADITGCLNQMLQSPEDPDSPEARRAQQTMFAIEEVRTLMSERDYDGAATAARDAAKEWRSK
jgi:hypothetical protein